MSWSYRVCAHKEDDGNGGKETLYSIREVFLIPDPNRPTGSRPIMGYGEASVSNWTSADELRRTLDLMLRAFDKPVLGDTE